MIDINFSLNFFKFFVVIQLQLSACRVDKGWVSFTAWIISLSIMLSSSIHAVKKGRSSFFLPHSIPLCKCITVFFIHSFTDGHLCCCLHLAIVNCAAMNIGVHGFFCIGVSGLSLIHI